MRNVCDQQRKKRSDSHKVGERSGVTVKAFGVDRLAVLLLIVGRL